MFNGFLLSIIGLLVCGYFYHRYTIKQRRRDYVVTEVADFLTEKECQHIIQQAQALLTRSSTIRHGKTKASSLLRTSRSAFFTESKDPVIKNIQQRIADYTGMDKNCLEPLQVTHYQESQFYAPHYDALSAGQVKFGGEGDRQCTMIIYLNDNFQGGQTRFNKLQMRIQPQLGKAVVFNNLAENGKVDILSKHSADPVKNGEKWIINQWIRQYPFTD